MTSSACRTKPGDDSAGIVCVEGGEYENVAATFYDYHFFFEMRAQPRTWSLGPPACPRLARSQEDGLMPGCPARLSTSADTPLIFMDMQNMRIKT